ncbi:MAG TPA: hypothetical protein VN823_17710 [Stellaceae bacterium]|nr:hypothetical protein [Stellaceae bacterium]
MNRPIAIPRPCRFAALAVFALAVALGGCAVQPQDAQQRYEAAIADAAVASPEKVNPLLPVPAGATVGVVSWVAKNRVPCPIDQPQCRITAGAGRIWVTLAGEVQSQCRAWSLSGVDLRRRLEQLLGLPPDPPPQYEKAVFATMQVPRDALARPCLGIDAADPAHPKCTIAVPAQSAASADMQGFVGKQMMDSYVVHNPSGPGYPYTRLGYTYDWAPGAEAQFVVAPGTSLAVTDEVATDAYCAPTGSP